MFNGGIDFLKLLSKPKFRFESFRIAIVNIAIT